MTNEQKAQVYNQMMFEHTKLSAESEKSRKAVLYATYKSTAALDPKVILAYQSAYKSREVFTTLVNAHVQLSNHIWHADGSCDSDVARWWKEVDAKAYNVLVKSTALAEPYIQSHELQRRYKNVINSYPKKHNSYTSFIKEHCSTKASGH